MNTVLRKMIVAAEGRHLSPEEAAALREYAETMSSRVEAARRLEAVEDSIVRQAARRFVDEHPDYARGVPAVFEKTTRDMKLTLRYVAGAHVRDDPEFFRRAYAEWIAELLTDLTDPALIAAGYRGLRDSVEQHLDAADARVLNRYLDIFLAEIER